MEVLKTFILKTFYRIPFIKVSIDEALERSRREGSIEAFGLAQKDILETMADDLDKKANELVVKKMAEMLTIINLNDVLTIDKRTGVFYLGGEMANDARLANLKAEAEFLLQSDIWRVINNNIRDIAQKAMFVSSESLVDLQKGKSMLYTLQMQDNTINLLKGFIMK